MLEIAAFCLAVNIYFEARSEPTKGQIAVAQVTLNRAEKKGKRICEVVAEKKQFSWLNGKVHRKNGAAFAVFDKPEEQKAWVKAKKVAYITLNKEVPNHAKGATFYHTKKVNPKWNRNMKLVAVIGKHRFYRET